MSEGTFSHIPAHVTMIIMFKLSISKDIYSINKLEHRIITLWENFSVNC